MRRETQVPSGTRCRRLDAQNEIVIITHAVGVLIVKIVFDNLFNVQCAHGRVFGVLLLWVWVYLLYNIRYIQRAYGSRDGIFRRKGKKEVILWSAEMVRG